MEFPKDFIFGVSTSAYQIEGAVDQSGRTPSIWDEFCRVEGNVDNQECGDIACDHYHLFRTDVKLMAELGVDSYRFSISWPRIFPEKGKYNPEGMRFYQNLIRELKANNIKPMATLYHWDLPCWAQQLGGWNSRESVEWFLEYAKKCFEQLDGEVDLWVTHNEPWCASFLSHLIGEHAPGKSDLYEAFRVAHHLLLSHGKAVQLYRQMGGKHKIGIALNLTSVYAVTESFQDQLAANNYDVFINRFFLDPLFKARYPFDLFNCAIGKIPDYGFIQAGDLDIIAEKCDFFSFNYYTRSIVSFSETNLFGMKALAPEKNMTHMGWEVYPSGLSDIVHRLRKEYTDLPIHITENGAAYIDVPDQDGRVHDKERTQYIKMHLAEIAKLNEDAMNISGYYVWSLLDNFEWAHGYGKRFGIIYCDFDSQQRIPKDSYYYYQHVIERREL